MIPPLQRRRDAAQATLDRFKDQPFAFGKNDCVRLVAFHLRKLGYRPQLAKAGTYRTALSARRALERAGFGSLAEALDAIGLERIAPAAVIVGDVVQCEGDDELGALAVYVGNGRILGYSEDAAGAVVMQSLKIDLAWRAPPHV